jgi:hypothetical protein
MRDERGVGRFDLLRDAEEECGMRGGEARGEIRDDAECGRGMRDAGREGVRRSVLGRGRTVRRVMEGLARL